MTPSAAMRTVRDSGRLKQGLAQLNDVLHDDEAHMTTQGQSTNACEQRKQSFTAELEDDAAPGIQWVSVRWAAARSAARR